MYIKNLKELILYLVQTFREKRFWFSVKYIIWVLLDKINGVDYVKNEGYEKLNLNPEESSVFQATRDIKYLKTILDEMNIKPEDSILDLGCGKGYLLKIFSKYSFRKVGGVEISRRLCDIAKSNMKKEKIEKVSIYNENANIFDQYSDYNYIYMFNPFPGAVVKEVMKKLIEDLRKNTGKKVCIIYHNPVCHEEIISGGAFILKKKYKGKSTDYYVYENRL